MAGEPVLQPGRNCWRIARADRAAFLIDAAVYYQAVHQALRLARHSVLIVGWDVDGRVQLLRDPKESDGLPVELTPLLDALVRRHGLEVHILLWDYAMIYAFERQALPIVHLGWRTHRNIHVRLDGCHPLGASHHQKLLVIDDRLAFCGGLDLADQRWDTPEHRAEDPRRVTSSGDPYQPFHDVQIAVDGAAAASLGELARRRWRRATGRSLSAPERGTADPWPSGLSPSLRDLQVGIARTEPTWGAGDEVREVEQLYLDTIRRARRHLYLENQFLTSAVIGEELCRSLARSSGPEIVVVGPERASGWFEQATMGVLRARMMRRLHEADQHGRLRLFSPVQAGLPADQFINVHSKVTIVDDGLARVGSANLSNRSMGLDTECDLAIEAHDEAHRAAIVELRDGLLAEHLGRRPEEVARAVAEHGLIGGVERLRGGDRTLVETDSVVAEWLEEMVPESEVVDPERPLEYDAFVAAVIPREFRRPDPMPLLTRLHLWTALSALLIAWPWTFLERLIPIKRLIYWGIAPLPWPHDSLLVATLFLVGAALPLNILTVITVFLFGAGQGLPYSLGGALLSALCGYGVGRLLGSERLRRFTSAPLDRFGTQLLSARLITLAKARWLPFTSFHLINLVSGGWRVPLRKFLLGILMGVYPGVLFTVLFAFQLGRTVLQPGGWNGAALLFLLAAMYGLTLWLHRRLAR